MAFDLRYEGYGYETVEGMVPLIDQLGLKSKEYLEQEPEYTEQSSFFFERGQTPTELLTPDLSCC